MDTKNKARVNLPHLSWSGPAPENSIDAYALAMVVRMAATGPSDCAKRTMTMSPSVLTVTNIQLVAQLYAFYRNAIRDEGIRTDEMLLRFMSSSARTNVWAWAHENPALVNQAEVELINYVETNAVSGFRVFG